RSPGPSHPWSTRGPPRAARPGVFEPVAPRPLPRSPPVRRDDPGVSVDASPSHGRSHTMGTRTTRRAVCGAVCALALAAVTAPALAASASSGRPIARTDSGAVRGVATSGGFEFRGVPYAAPPIGDLRWRAPKRPASWDGVRDAT